MSAEDDADEDALINGDIAEEDITGDSTPAKKKRGRAAAAPAVPSTGPPADALERLNDLLRKTEQFGKFIGTANAPEKKGSVHSHGRDSGQCTSCGDGQRRDATDGLHSLCAIVCVSSACWRFSRGRAGRSHERAAEEEEDKELVNDELQQAEVKKSWSGIHPHAIRTNAAAERRSRPHCAANDGCCAPALDSARHSTAYLRVIRC